MEIDEEDDDPCVLMSLGLKEFVSGRVENAYRHWYAASLENPSMVMRLLNADVAESKQLDRLDMGESWSYLNAEWFEKWALNYPAFVALSVMWYDPDFRWSIGIKVPGRDKKRKNETAPQLDFEKMASEYKEILTDESSKARFWNAVLTKRIAYINAVRTADRTNNKKITDMVIKLSRPLIELDLELQDGLEDTKANRLSETEIEKALEYVKGTETVFQYCLNQLNCFMQRENSLSGRR